MEPSIGPAEMGGAQIADCLGAMPVNRQWRNRLLYSEAAGGRSREAGRAKSSGWSLSPAVAPSQPDSYTKAWYCQPQSGKIATVSISPD